MKRTQMIIVFISVNAITFQSFIPKQSLAGFPGKRGEAAPAAADLQHLALQRTVIHPQWQIFLRHLFYHPQGQVAAVRVDPGAVAIRQDDHLALASHRPGQAARLIDQLVQVEVLHPAG